MIQMRRAAWLFIEPFNFHNPHSFKLTIFRIRIIRPLHIMEMDRRIFADGFVDIVLQFLPVPGRNLSHIEIIVFIVFAAAC